MRVGVYLAAIEPLFTFEAGLPPDRLRQLSVRQIREHLLWYEAHRGPVEFEWARG
ncbi:hypothetical protein ACWCHM_26160 [Micromonospora sp. SCSIO 07396]